MKEKPYVKVAMYALNIIFAIIIIVPAVSYTHLTLPTN